MCVLPLSVVEAVVVVAVTLVADTVALDAVVKHCKCGVKWISLQP